VPRRLPSETAAKKAVLLNDTSTWYHWGCTATSAALKENIAARGYALESIAHLEVAQTPVDPPTLTQFDDRQFLSDYRYKNPSMFHTIASCDRLIINGEGTIHNLAPNAVRLLYLAYVAKTVFGKKVDIINHACFPEDSAKLTDPNVMAYYLKTYRVLDRVVVRDAISHQLLNALGIKNTLGFDSLPLTARKWIARHGLPARQKHVILAGSSLFSALSARAYEKNIKDLLDDGYRVSVLIGSAIHKAGEDKPFCDFVQALFGDRVDIIDAQSLDEWFTLLGGAALLVSGRFHYSIAAACFGTPFVAFEGNTPKLHALCDLLKEKEPLHYDATDLSAQMTVRITKALRAGPLPEKDRADRLDTLCGLAMKNYEEL
jgi:polysaccharide pyruvyl transferase WcaK-like protein